jgi:hypothetical protein
MRQTVTKELFSYWSRLKGARSAPDRSDIDPAAIRHVLADTFIIEIDGGCVFPIRLSGTRLNALWLHDQKGASFLELWREEDRRGVAAALLTVIDGVTPVVAGVRARAAEAARTLELEMLLLPLRHFGKTHSRLLGSLAPSCQPDWLGRAPAQPLELVSLRVIGASEQKGLTLNPHVVFSPWPAPGSRPRLVVYEGGKPR